MSILANGKVCFHANGSFLGGHVVWFQCTWTDFPMSIQEPLGKGHLICNLANTIIAGILTLKLISVLFSDISGKNLVLLL